MRVTFKPYRLSLPLSPPSLPSFSSLPPLHLSPHLIINTISFSSSTFHLSHTPFSFVGACVRFLCIYIALFVFPSFFIFPTSLFQTINIPSKNNKQFLFPYLIFVIFFPLFYHICSNFIY